ncbi:LuxR C-terminal-related transcriptional regulator [Cedecea lapagei]|uniref:LuxR C-terminal-related transcriptional regulator n=1 Tax=Cedecea lapagei TaxID=158823 RepID=UPI001BCCFBE3|nr:LuxR C-terminal-related transcriptional regulator [Cedecea lapagei]
MSEKKPAITLVYDIPVEKLYSHSRCLSKRDSIESMNRFLSDSVQGRKKEKSNITPRQMIIIKRLTSGDTVKSIAREHNRSIKTVSAIKNNILVKIGLKPMNDLSLLIVDMIICSAGLKKIM